MLTITNPLYIAAQVAGDGLVTDRSSVNSASQSPSTSGRVMAILAHSGAALRTMPVVIQYSITTVAITPTSPSS